MDKRERVNAAYQYLRGIGIVHTQKDLARRIGATPANVSTALKGDELCLTDNFLKRLNKAFDNVFNIDWLLSGEGEMLSDSPPAPSSGEPYFMVPVVHIDSVGGMHSQNDILSPEYIECYYPIAGAKPGDVAIYQSGNSMTPAIPPGSLLLIREVPEWREYVGYGDVFVLLLTDDRRITKELRRYDEAPKDYFWCVSYNPDVANEELPKRMISRVWKVIKVLIDKGW